MYKDKFIDAEQNGRQEAISEVRDRLSEHIETDYGLNPVGDIHYVEWSTIEKILDELQKDYE